MADELRIERVTGYVPFVMLGVKTPKKTSTPEKNIAIAEALVAEFTAAYARIGQ
jgi:hypothetical protein